jgi:radical SAM superfamily enzyme YgiQ (UPF0313 family)
VPRTKTPQQILEELQSLHDLGYRGHVDFVDDNLIGNRKSLRGFLPKLIAWQRAHDYPFEFSTEASINLADDNDLLELMRAANFFSIFIGIESPDPDTLVHTKKKQNTRLSLVESIHKLYRAGIYVTAGFIIGFDSEKTSMADAMVEFIREAAIPVAMVGLLSAFPNTQLTRRLEKEGRLHKDFDRVFVRIDETHAWTHLTPSVPNAIFADYRNVLSASTISSLCSAREQLTDARCPADR